MATRFYVCECCKEKFETDRTEDEVENEYKELFPNIPDRARTCEECFIKIMKFNEPNSTRYYKYVDEGVLKNADKNVIKVF